MPVKVVRLGRVKEDAVSKDQGVKSVEIGVLVKRLFRVRRAWKEVVCGKMRFFQQGSFKMYFDVEGSDGSDAQAVKDMQDNWEMELLCGTADARTEKGFQWRFSPLELDALYYGNGHLEEVR